MYSSLQGYLVRTGQWFEIVTKNPKKKKLKSAGAVIYGLYQNVDL